MYGITTSILGERHKPDKEKVVLNRLIRWCPGIGLSLEADPRHVRVMVKEMGCESTLPLKVPAARAAKEETLDEREKGSTAKKDQRRIGEHQEEASVHSCIYPIEPQRSEDLHIVGCARQLFNT